MTDPAPLSAAEQLARTRHILELYANPVGVDIDHVAHDMGALFGRTGPNGVTSFVGGVLLAVKNAIIGRGMLPARDGRPDAFYGFQLSAFDVDTGIPTGSVDDPDDPTRIVATALSLILNDDLESAVTVLKPRLAVGATEEAGAIVWSALGLWRSFVLAPNTAVDDPVGGMHAVTVELVVPDMDDDPE